MRYAVKGVSVGTIGDRYCLRSGPPLSYSLGYGFCGNSCDFRPFRCSKSLPVMGNDNVSAGIPGLLLFGGPSAVFWGVSLVPVDSVERMAWGWHRSHVGQEVLERALPSIAYGYAFGCPIPPRLPLAAASGFHSKPRFVFRRSRSSVCFIKAGDLFNRKTAAAFDFPREKVRCLNRKLGPASAIAVPPRVPLKHPRIRGHCESAKWHSSQVHASASVKWLTKLYVAVSVFCHALILAHDSGLSSAMAKAKPAPKK